jgi:hypothetical protein
LRIRVVTQLVVTTEDYIFFFWNRVAMGSDPDKEGKLGREQG